MVGFISGAEAGQPRWIVAYQQAWVAVMTHTSPLFVGIMSALTEVIIAWSLLTGTLLRIFLPIGLIYSLMIWSPAEGFGGPYGNGRTGMPSNMLGNTIIYALIFAFFIVIYKPRIRSEKSA